MTDQAPRTEESKVLLLINKRGFRHTRQDHQFIASQVNWAYDQPFVPVAEFIRAIMRGVQSEITQLPREKRQRQSETTIILSRASADSTSVSEQLYHEQGFNFEVDDISPDERNELSQIVEGKVQSASAQFVAAHLRDLATGNYLNSTMACNLNTGNVFNIIASALTHGDTALVPLNMEHEQSEERNVFKLTVASTSPLSNYVGRIELMF